MKEESKTSNEASNNQEKARVKCQVERLVMPTYQDFNHALCSMFSDPKYIDMFPRCLAGEIRSIHPHPGTTAREIINVASAIAVDVSRDKTFIKGA